MTWTLLESYKNFNLWRNETGGYNETFRKGVDPNIHRKKSLLELEIEEESMSKYTEGE